MERRFYTSSENTRPSTTERGGRREKQQKSVEVWAYGFTRLLPGACVIEVNFYVLLAAYSFFFFSFFYIWRFAVDMLKYSVLVVDWKWKENEMKRRNEILVLLKCAFFFFIHFFFPLRRSSGYGHGGLALVWARAREWKWKYHHFRLFSHLMHNTTIRSRSVVELCLTSLFSTLVSHNTILHTTHFCTMKWTSSSSRRLYSCSTLDYLFLLSLFFIQQILNAFHIFPGFSFHSHTPPCFMCWKFYCTFFTWLKLWHCRNS